MNQLHLEIWQTKITLNDQISSTSGTMYFNFCNIIKWPHLLIKKDLSPTLDQYILILDLIHL